MWQMAEQALRTISNMDTGVTNLSATNGATNNTIRDATVSLNRTNSPTTVYQNITTTPTQQSGANSYNKYLNLKLTNTRYAIMLTGNSSYRDVGAEIGSTSSNVSASNRFKVGLVEDDIGYASSTYGIYATYQEAIRIHDCDVSNLATSGSSYSIYGIYAAYLFGISEISGNRVYGLRNISGDVNATGSLTGIYLNTSTSGSNEIRCFNNTISGFSHPRTSETTTFYLYGISHQGGVAYIDHNSILINPTTSGASSVGLYLTGSYSYTRNNAIVNRAPNQTTAKHYIFYTGSSTNHTSNYNLAYIANPSNGIYGNNSGSDYATWDNWYYNTGRDYNSVLANPYFANESLNDLRIASNVVSPVNNAGTQISWITTDIEGTTRSTTTPDIGCNEGNFTTSPLTGTKTVGGSSPDYPTITDAINAVTSIGVGSGGVTFNIRPGTYSDALTVTPIPGASITSPRRFPSRIEWGHCRSDRNVINHRLGDPPQWLRLGDIRWRQRDRSGNFFRQLYRIWFLGYQLYRK